MSTEAITLAESSRLVELEEVIENGIGTFKSVGAALWEINRDRLYRSNYETFEAYCKEEWELARSTAYQLIEASKVAENVRHGGQTNVMPQNERQTRPLTKLPAEQQPAAWSKAVESANGAQPTARQVEAAVEEVRAEAEPEAPKRERAFQPSNGMQYAALAIENLKKIQPNDTERDKAYMAVQRFLTQNYQPK